MGVNKSMKIFFEGMLYGTLEGYKGKVVNTAMGPFQWDDLQEAWINTNNGFKLANISMQDLLLYGYESSDNNKTDTCDYITNVINNGEAITNNLEFGDSGSWEILDAIYTVQNYDCPIQLGFTITSDGTPITNNFAGLSGYSIQYSVDGSAYTTINNDTRITVNPPAFTYGPGGITIKFFTEEVDINNLDPSIVSLTLNLVNYSANPSYTIATNVFNFTDI